MTKQKRGAVGDAKGDDDHIASAGRTTDKGEGMDPIGGNQLGATQWQTRGEKEGSMREMEEERAMRGKGERR